jgi:hypothetical protein
MTIVTVVAAQVTIARNATAPACLKFNARTRAQRVMH